jgi:hypothetical protein
MALIFRKEDAEHDRATDDPLRVKQLCVLPPWHFDHFGRHVGCWYSSDRPFQIDLFSIDLPVAGLDSLQNS